MPTSSPSAFRESGASSPLADSLLALAPFHLPNRRRTRYVGDDVCVALDSLAGRDRTLLTQLYGTLCELLSCMVATNTDDSQKWQEVIRWTETHSLDRIIDEVRELGVASYAQDSGEDLAKALHDLRGGALSALLGRLQLMTFLPQNESELQTLFVLTRDHLKIMRNALVGLDEPRRNADRSPRSHDASLILEKWHDAVVGPKWRELPVKMFIDCRYKGALTECCLESAAIDRIFYNLAGNACRHAVGGRLDMAIFPVSEGPEGCLRFVLSNEVSEEDAKFLRSLLPNDNNRTDRGSGKSLYKLFEPTVSSTGSGFGLTVAADFVASAFGLKDRHEALRERYVGAVLEDQAFRVWFHWPIASDKLPAKLDDYHRPHESLSEPQQ